MIFQKSTAQISDRYGGRHTRHTASGATEGYYIARSACLLHSFHWYWLCHLHSTHRTHQETARLRWLVTYQGVLSAHR